jgi:rod shape-determining protein MreC
VKASQWLSLFFNSQMQLIAENARLQEQNLRLQATLQKFDELSSENTRIRNLLRAKPKTSEQVQMAEVLAVELDPTACKLTINQGKNNGVFEGQAVVDAQGIMGQVIRVGLWTSTVMLITDPNHEIPVQVARTRLPAVAVGTGMVNRLNLLYLPTAGIKAGIKVGDLLVTSGQGGHFPSGYPVGTVVEVSPDISQPYVQVQVVPKALLERSREVLLVWEDKTGQPVETTVQSVEKKEKK